MGAARTMVSVAYFTWPDQAGDPDKGFGMELVNRTRPSPSHE
jgi:hypothetical protein